MFVKKIFSDCWLDAIPTLDLETEQFDKLWKLCTVSISFKLWYVSLWSSIYLQIKDEWYNQSFLLCFRLPFSIQYVLFSTFLKFSVIYYFTERLYIYKMRFDYTVNKIFREFDLNAVCKWKKPHCNAYIARTKNVPFVFLL